MATLGETCVFSTPAMQRTGDDHSSIVHASGRFWRPTTTELSGLEMLKIYALSATVFLSLGILFLTYA